MSFYSHRTIKKPESIDLTSISGFHLVAHRLQDTNPENLFGHDLDYWMQIYENLKQLCNLKDLVAPLEERRLKEQQEQTQREQKG